MGTTAVIGLGILAWGLLAVLVALFVGRMIRLRDEQRPDRTEQGAPVEGEPSVSPGDGRWARYRVRAPSWLGRRPRGR